jgi:hypothetical protein
VRGPIETRFETPSCSNGHRMVVSSYADSEYRTGYVGRICTNTSVIDNAWFSIERDPCSQRCGWCWASLRAWIGVCAISAHAAPASCHLRRATCVAQPPLCRTTCFYCLPPAYLERNDL